MTETLAPAASIVIGVGAVVFRGDDVLLIRRARPPFEGRWSIPGGRINLGERLWDAARREVREETGVEIALLGLIDVFEALPAAPSETHYVMIDYAAVWASGEPRAGDDAIAAEFVPVEEAEARLGWDETRRALRQALTLRRAASKPL